MPGPLHAVDWAIIALYVAFALWVGVRYAKRAGENVDEYFLSGRTLPWWIAGTSMVATSFAADTPLLITGWVRDSGIWMNWVWWCYLIGGTFQVFLFARWWRRAGVMTKAELVELRYGGSGASALRIVLGLFHACVTNTMTLCWVLLAAAKISTVLFEVDKFVGLSIACAIAMAYSLMAGFWGVVVTDLAQFVVAMVGAVALAWFSWDAVGGYEGVAAAVEAGRVHVERLHIIPDPGAGEFWTASLAAFAVYLGVSWWAVENVDGATVTVQRVCAAKDERHGLLAVLWFNVSHYAMRPWCWILVGLASLIVIPNIEVAAPALAAPATVAAIDADAIELTAADGEALRVSLATEESTDDWAPLPKVKVGDVVESGAIVAATDSERAYMVMMVRFLPIGLLGLVAASLIAAFMSTIDTHVNLAASYFVNDVYERFLRPNASQAEYVRVARIASVFVLLLGASFAASAESVRDLFVFFLAFLGGVGPVYVLRWLWWRIRASTEITAMLTSAIVSTAVTHIEIDWALGALSPGGELSGAGRVVVVAACSVSAALLSMLATRAPDPATLVEFYRRTRPLGAWGPVRALVGDEGRDPRDEAAPALVGAAGGIALVYGVLLGLGFYFLDQGEALLYAGVAAVAGLVSVRWAIRKLTG